MPLSFLRGGKRRRFTEVDRLLALALTIHEGSIDPSHGQRRALALDPDLADEWTYIDPTRDFAELTLARAAETKRDTDHPHAWRYVVGLREGWEQRKAAKVAGRAAATSEA